jgi:hypothetical protein
MLDKRAVLVSIYRVLRFGGRFFCLAPHAAYVWYRTIAPLLGFATKHLSSDRMLTHGEFSALLDQAGFRRIRSAPWSFIPKGDVHALVASVCFLRQRCAPGGRFPCGLAFGSHLFVSNVGPSDRYSGSCLHATSSRAHGASARRSDALRWLATGWSGLSGGPGFRISPSLASVVLCWLRSRQHP